MRGVHVHVCVTNRKLVTCSIVQSDSQVMNSFGTKLKLICVDVCE